MQSAFDTELARRDPLLPGLATLLDPGAFLAMLRAQAPGARLEAAQITYLRYKPATSCVVGYRLHGPDLSVDAYAKAFRRDAAEKFRKAALRPRAAGPLGPGRLLLDREMLEVCFFPNDDKLPSLARLGDPEGRKRLLRRVFHDRPDLWDAAVEALRYNPERRFVGKVVADGQPAAVLKFSSPAGFEAARAGARAFRSQGPLRLARRIAFSRRHNVLGFEWLRGRGLRDALIEGDAGAAELRRVGEALAALHAQQSHRIPTRTADDELDALLEAAASVAWVCPPLAARALDLAHRIGADLGGLPGAPRPIHGDFHAKQVLLLEEGVAFVDLDEAVRGDPAADLGNFAAHLEIHALRGHLRRDLVEPLGGALLGGYASAAPAPEPGRVGVHTAAGLLKLAPFPFRHREPDWVARTEALLRRAEELLAQAEPLLAARAREPAAAPLAPLAPPAPRASVEDPLGASRDPAMPFLARALEPRDAERLLSRCLPGADGGRVRVRAIRVRRHKPGRRCLLEYDVLVERPGGPPEALTLIAKSRVKGANVATHGLMAVLRRAGFGDDSLDGVLVPEPLGVAPHLRMWLQRKVAGTPSIQLLEGLDGPALARRIADAIRKLHVAHVPTQRRHAMSDELRILRDRLTMLAAARPGWGPRLEGLLEGCERVGASVAEPAPRGIHRDFYHDHVLVDGPRLYLLDFDLYCLGDPALDVGNFLGHLTVHSLTTTGAPGALAGVERAMEDRYAALAGEECRDAVRAYRFLTLARHIELSTRFPERRPFTAALLELCEREAGDLGA